MLGGSLESFQSVQHLFTAYTTANAQDFHDRYAAESAVFTPIRLHVSTLIVNRDLTNQLGVNITGWESLKDERLSGRVAYMDPAASSPVSEQTAFVTNFAGAINITSPSALRLY